MGLIFANSMVSLWYFIIDRLGFCFVSEAIKLDIELKNPLHISICVSGVSPICDLCANSSEAAEFGMEMALTLFKFASHIM